MRTWWSTFKIAFEQHLTTDGSKNRAAKDCLMSTPLTRGALKDPSKKKHAVVQWISSDGSIH